MELDDMKQAWQTLSRQLERQQAVQTQLLLETKLDKARSSLRPLFWGQLLQILFGIPFVLLASLLWMRAGAIPDGLPLGAVLAGIVVHVYGVATIALAGETLRRIRGIDHAAPILEIQKRLARLRRIYIISGMVGGLPWWFLWVLLLMVLAGLGGDDLYARAPFLVWIGLGVGVAGLLGTWWFHRWSRSPARPRLARAMENSLTGRSLRKAQAQLEEIDRFARE